LTAGARVLTGVANALRRSVSTFEKAAPFFADAAFPFERFRALTRVDQAAA